MLLKQLTPGQGYRQVSVDSIVLVVAGHSRAGICKGSDALLAVQHTFQGLMPPVPCGASADSLRNSAKPAEVVNVRQEPSASIFV